MTRSSYQDYGVTAQTALVWQKHPRAVARALKPRNNRKISSWWRYKTPTAITPATANAAAAATVGTQVAALAVTESGAGLADTYVFTFAANPGNKFAIVGNKVNVAAALVAGPVNLSIKATASHSGKSVTGPLVVTVT